MSSGTASIKEMLPLPVEIAKLSDEEFKTYLERSKKYQRVMFKLSMEMLDQLVKKLA